MTRNLKNFYSAMEALLKLKLSSLELMEHIKLLGPYEGRGHGGRHRPKGRFLGRPRNATSKYRPHQGKQECARRIRSGGPTPIPRRVWYGVHPNLGAEDAFPTRREALRDVKPSLVRYGYDKGSAIAVLL